MGGSTAATHVGGARGPDLTGGLPTTAGVIAMGNLDARIEGLTSQAARGRLTADGWGEWVELTALRGHVLGRIDEVEGAASLAERFVDQAPRDPRSLVTRARVRLQTPACGPTPGHAPRRVVVGRRCSAWTP
ncbi:hypothetical protein AB0O11_33445, partial [Kitasatospora sp. NPDC093102]